MDQAMALISLTRDVKPMNEIELAIAQVTGAMCGDQEDVAWINNGYCYEWADQVFALLKDTKHEVEYWENPFGFADTTHAFLWIDGKFYDAECPNGVEDHIGLANLQEVVRAYPTSAGGVHHRP